ncbi:Formyltransferase/hydrolase complex Fhc subunit B [Labrys miyagiensis]
MRAWIKGRSVEQGEAIAAIGEMLARARYPLVGGLSGDVDALRAAYRLAFRAGAALDSNGSDALYADLGTLASRGAMTTTWAEARERADLLLIVGGAAADSPTIADLLARAPTRAGAASRQLVSVGRAVRSELPQQVVDSDASRLPATLALLRAVVSRRLPSTGDAAQLAGVARQIGDCRFGVAVYDPAELGALGVDMLQGLVKDLNENTRFSGLPVGIEKSSRAALAVGAWTTGEPPRIGLGRGYPEHDPWRFDAARLVSSGEADAILWLGDLGPGVLAEGRTIPTAAVLVHARGEEADIVVEVADPWEHGMGSVFDERRGTFVHVEAASPGGQPSAAFILNAIGDALPKQEGDRPC